MLEKLEELLRAKPFVPFRIIMTSGHHYDVHSPYLVAIGESVIGYFFPKSDCMVNLRKTELSSIETLEPSKN
jgi:hypothetical protein